MAEPAGKRVADSYLEQVYIVEAQHLNRIQTFFGGQLLSWMDVIAGEVATRHSDGSSTMVAVDEMQVTTPAHLGDKLVYTGKLTNVGRTSMEIFVEVFIEDAEKNRKSISEAYIMTVALDDGGRPRPVPPLIVETEEEKALWEAAEQRKARRNSRRGK